MDFIFKKKKGIPFKNFLVAISLIMVVFVLAIISVIFYINIKKYMTGKMDEINTSKMYQYASDIDNIYDQVSKVAVYIQNNEQLKELVRKSEDPGTKIFDKHMYSEEIYRILSNTAQYNSIIKSINIITDKYQYESGDLFFSTYLTKTLSQQYDRGIKFNYPVEAISQTGVKGTESSVVTSLEGKSYFSFSLYSNNKIYGSGFIILSDEYLSKCLSNNDCILLFDEELNIVHKGSFFDNINSRSLISNIDKNGKKMVFADSSSKVYYNSLSFNNFSILYLAKMQSYARQTDYIKKLVFACFLLSVIISAVFSRLISHRLLKPVFKLTGLLKKYKAGYPNTDFYYRGDKSKASLKEKMFYYLIISILLPVSIFIGVFYLQSNRIMNEQISNNYFTAFEKTANSLTEYLYAKENIIKRISFNILIQNYIIQEKKPDVSLINNIIEQNIYLGLARDTISIYNSSNQIVFSNQFKQKKNMDEDYCQMISNVFRETVWSVNTDDLNRTNISLGMPVISIFDLNRIGTRIGYSRIDIDYAYASEVFGHLNTDNIDVYMVNKSGLTITNPQKYILGENSNTMFDDECGIKYHNINGARYIFFYKKIGDTPWYLVSKACYSDFTKQSSIVFSNNIYLFIIIILFVTILSYYISISLLKPVNKLNKLLGSLDLSSMDDRIAEDYYIDEINDLGINFNEMLERLEDLFDELMVSNAQKNQLELEKKNAEIIALQAQINPHFLYNTLDNIIYLVKGDMKDNAVQMIKDLSNLFRYGISKGDITIKVKEEIMYARAYANIMKFRVGSRINFLWDVDENPGGYRTIKLILQPIIENAIYHGFNKNNGSGNIEIKYMEEDENIKFIIKDNGLGIPPGKLDVINSNLGNIQFAGSNERESGDIDADTGSKIGIYNVQLRIRLHYGDKYGIRLESTYGMGTTVTLAIPKVYDEQD